MTKPLSTAPVAGSGMALLVVGVAIVLRMNGRLPATEEE